MGCVALFRIFSEETKDIYEKNTYFPSIRNQLKNCLWKLYKFDGFFGIIVVSRSPHRESNCIIDTFFTVRFTASINNAGMTQP